MLDRPVRGVGEGRGDSPGRGSDMDKMDSMPGLVSPLRSIAQRRWTQRKSVVAVIIATPTRETLLYEGRISRPPDT
jgi:hypothetical protein